MIAANMRYRAIIFDLYDTILAVGPAPANAEEQWALLWADRLADLPRLSLKEFMVGCEKIIVREHASARAIGVEHPEVYWPAVAREVLPELARLPETDCGEFLFEHARLQRTIHIPPAARDILIRLPGTDALLGIASNAQPYTLRELDAALAEMGLNRSIFTPQICFWSFETGFAKPNPHAFRILSARLRKLGIAASETLMVGTRADNDIAPAAAQGWLAWRLTAALPGDGITSGNWAQLSKRLNLPI